MMTTHRKHMSGAPCASPPHHSLENQNHVQQSGGLIWLLYARVQVQINGIPVLLPSVLSVFILGSINNSELNPKYLSLNPIQIT